MTKKMVIHSSNKSRAGSSIGSKNEIRNDSYSILESKMDSKFSKINAQQCTHLLEQKISEEE